MNAKQRFSRLIFNIHYSGNNEHAISIPYQRKREGSLYIHQHNNYNHYTLFDGMAKGHCATSAIGCL